MLLITALSQSVSQEINSASTHTRNSSGNEGKEQLGGLAQPGTGSKHSLLRLAREVDSPNFVDTALRLKLP